MNRSREADRNRILPLLVVVVLAHAVAACAHRDPAPVGAAEPTVPRAAVTAALTDAGSTAPPGATVLYAPPEPTRLRPCCVFGHDLKVKFGVVPVPAFTLENIRGPDDVGSHEYRAGLLQIAPGPVQGEGGQASREHNGIAYTCRGGFIDTAHIRDFADLAWFLAAQVNRRLESGGSIELADLGGRRRIVLEPIAAEQVLRAGRIPLSIAIAQWLSFELSIWREIATWYGHESVPPWPEKISAFSPEDLYSNLLGTKLAGGILGAGGIENELDYDRAMSVWLPAALEILQIVPKESSAAAMKAADGILWDSSRRVPDWQLVLRRKFDLGPVVTPWLVDLPANSGCAETREPLVLRRIDRVGAISIAAHAEIEIVVDEDLAKKGFPFPRPGDGRVTHEDFPRIVEQLKREAAAASPTSPEP